MTSRPEVDIVESGHRCTTGLEQPFGQGGFGGSICCSRLVVEDRQAGQSGVHTVEMTALTTWQRPAQTQHRRPVGECRQLGEWDRVTVGEPWHQLVETALRRASGDEQQAHPADEQQHERSGGDQHCRRTRSHPTMAGRDTSTRPTTQAASGTSLAAVQARTPVLRLMIAPTRSSLRTSEQLTPRQPSTLLACPRAAMTVSRERSTDCVSPTLFTTSSRSASLRFLPDLISYTNT